MENFLINIGDKTNMKLLSKIHIVQFKNSVPIPEENTPPLRGFSSVLRQKTACN